MKNEYRAPDGWKTLCRVDAGLAQVKASTPAESAIYGIFNAIWKDYVKTRPARRMLKELCVAVHPLWLKAALASAEMQAVPKKIEGGYCFYGLRMREDASVGRNEMMVEEKQL